jgi:hypothetical protein
MEKRPMPKKTDPNRALIPPNKIAFYEKVLDEAEQLDFQMAAGVDGIDDEIALLRVLIKSSLKTDSKNVQLMVAATNMLAKLVKTRYSINRAQNKGLKEALGNVIKDIAVPLGVVTLSKKL